MNPFNDLLQRLWMVDNVERLGISRHFENEIKSAIESNKKYSNQILVALSTLCLIYKYSLTINYLFKQLLE